MASFQVTKNQDRLDSIILNHYGSLLMFDEIVKINPHLSNVILSKGDVVELPAFIPQQIEEKLW